MKNLYFLLISFCFLGSVHAQIVNIPDANFKAKLLEADNSNGIASIEEADENGIVYSFDSVDTNGDGEIQLSEAQAIKYLNIDYSKVSNLEGINSFSNLTILAVQWTQITNLNLNGLSNLTRLYCPENNLQTLDVSALSNLRTLGCSFNQLTSLNVSGLNNLIDIGCNNNKLTSLDLSNLNNLLGFDCSGNLLTSIDLRGCTKLVDVDCNNNLFTELDFSESISLSSLEFYNNIQLTYLNIKNGSIEDLIFDGNINLKYICVDDSQLEYVEWYIQQKQMQNIQLNTYCSFSPGGDFYTIKGKNTFDTNSNGCDTNDGIYPNMKYYITNGVSNGNIISNDIGFYSIPVQDGTHTITPVLENQNYYTVSPASINVTFPTEPSPFTQDFCITPNGNHQDLEVTILPTIPARPGFDATYKIIYKNKGNQIQSGAVSLSFDDEVLDYVSAIPIINNQVTDQLIWDYTNLQPFETREITVILNVNSPMETPAVNANDRLSFTALINPLTGDEKPVDNSSALRQQVVGSFDPNDKTCLEGDIITPDLIGEYVHYLIRFENTGNYAAENIVVKDMIDLSKFDISTLVPTKASHEFVAKISDGNKVEFIFENINLPFDDATNDGYLAFKIKTLPTLVVGDTFTNEANIYFDYNFPILTNKAATTIQTLGTSVFEFSTYFNVFPNPTTEVLNISLKKIIAIQSLAIYDVLGQIVIAVPDAKSISKINVSTLKTGTYFIKMNTDKGIANAKFMKN